MNRKTESDIWEDIKTLEKDIEKQQELYDKAKKASEKKQIKDNLNILNALLNYAKEFIDF